jgi:Ca-activated chloride channel family protein
MDTSANLILAWPWALVLLALPWLAGHLAKRLGLAFRPTAALKLPTSTATPEPEKKLPRLRSLSLWYWVWVLLVLALTRPELQQPEIQLEQQSRELLLVVDVSGSMQEIMDGRTRLDHVKQVVEDFVRRRSQDKMGLVVFGAQAYLYVPKTLDHELLLQQLNGMQPNMAGQGTALGDALGVSIRTLRQAQGEAAILLLTDGANNAGLLSPEEALQMATTAGIRTHLVVVSLNPEPQMAAQIRATGGEVFSAFNRRELEGVYQQLDNLEPATLLRRFSPADPLGYWLILAALGLSSWLLKSSIRRRLHV